jgi:hypothetical protein
MKIMSGYLNKMKLIQTTLKYTLYFDEETEELVIYNGFSTFAFTLDHLGDDVYRGAHNPRKLD